MTTKTRKFRAVRHFGCAGSGCGGTRLWAEVGDDSGEWHGTPAFHVDVPDGSIVRVTVEVVSIGKDTISDGECGNPWPAHYCKNKKVEIP